MSEVKDKIQSTQLSEWTMSSDILSRFTILTMVELLKDKQIQKIEKLTIDSLPDYDKKKLEVMVKKFTSVIKELQLVKNKGI